MPSIVASAGSENSSSTALKIHSPTMDVDMDVDVPQPPSPHKKLGHFVNKIFIRSPEEEKESYEEGESSKQPRTFVIQDHELIATIPQLVAILRGPPTPLPRTVRSFQISISSLHDYETSDLIALAHCLTPFESLTTFGIGVYTEDLASVSWSKLPQILQIAVFRQMCLVEELILHAMYDIPYTLFHHSCRKVRTLDLHQLAFSDIGEDKSIVRFEENAPPTVLEKLSMFLASTEELQQFTERLVYAEKAPFNARSLSSLTLRLTDEFSLGEQLLKGFVEQTAPSLKSFTWFPCIENFGGRVPTGPLDLSSMQSLSSLTLAMFIGSYCEENFIDPLPHTIATLQSLDSSIQRDELVLKLCSPLVSHPDHVPHSPEWKVLVETIFRPNPLFKKVLLQIQIGEPWRSTEFHKHWEQMEDGEEEELIEVIGAKMERMIMTELAPLAEEGVVLDTDRPTELKPYFARI